MLSNLILARNYRYISFSSFSKTIVEVIFYKHITYVFQAMIYLQIGSLTVNFTEEGHPELLVAQPGGEYVTMTFKQGSELDLSSDSEGYVWNIY